MKDEMMEEIEIPAFNRKPRPTTTSERVPATDEDLEMMIYSAFLVPSRDGDKPAKASSPTGAPGSTRG